jgi:hypothetical protein
VGNIVELCAAELYPDPKLYLGFTMCLSKDYQHIPDRSLIEDCALEHSLDFSKLNECATREDGGFGMEMLRDSVRRSIDVRFPAGTACNICLTFCVPRLVLRSPARCDWTTRYIAYGMGANGRTARMELVSTILSLLSRNSTKLLEGLKYFRPQLTSFSNCIIQSYRIHSDLSVSRH